MTIIEIENNLNNLISNFNKETFIFDLLLAYGTPKSTIKRLIGSDHDKLDSNGELIVRKKLFFKVASKNLHSVIDELKTQKEVTKHSPRFIIVTDFETLLAYDTKTSDSLDTELLNIVNHYDFFLPLAGMEKANFQDENPADVRASIKMAKLYDELQKNNKFESKEDIHSLNVFLTRLLFCYFAEDTNIFEENLFTYSISSHTLPDGSDVNNYMERLFSIFNTPTDKREKNTPEYLQKFPYVNGGLFKDVVKVPTFTTKSRNILIEVGQLKWSEINPDIFGSMIQAVVTSDHRGNMGMHYTSVPNIMKVIEPLFLDELYLEFEKAYENKSKLQMLLNRLAKIKIFDPACGSGNFLIIAYKKLRQLEMSIMQRIDSLSKEKTFQFSEIKLTQFYGIELDDFAHEVAMLSLWLAEHQMNLEFYKAFGRTSPSLPLQNGGNIVHGKQRKALDTGRKNKKTDKSKWQRVENAHEPIIDKDTFYRVQERIELIRSKHLEGSKPNPEAPKKPDNILVYKTKCACCGGSVLIGRHHTYSEKFYYKCKNRRKLARLCDNKYSYDYSEVMDSVFSVIRQHMSLCVEKTKFVQKMNSRKENVLQYDIYTKQIAKLQNDVRRITANKSGLYEDYREQLITAEELCQYQREYESRVNEIEAQITELLHRRSLYEKEFHIDEGWEETVNKYMAKRKLTKELVDAFVSEIVFYDGNIEVKLLYDDFLKELLKVAEEREVSSNG